MSSIQNKVVIITGASSGIGKATALETAFRGARLVLAARRIEALMDVVDQCKNIGAQVIGIVTDVSKDEDCRILIGKAVEQFGQIDILINNAGISMRALFEKTDLSVIRKLMDVNFWGTVYCTKYALPYLIKNKGSVVGVSSVAGYKGLPGRTGYSASKFAMQGFLDALRVENLKNELHVMVACPGFTASNIRNTALSADGSQQGESPRDESKMMSSEAVAKYLIKAIEKRKRTIVLTTQGKVTVFLNKFIPSFFDRMLYNHMAKEHDSPFK
ncbi:MAG: SDR family oxidoreductase [Bacteroidales bacterium]|nr:SDR family oxidoreductase [Bacteroidales bacterium]